MASKAAKRGFKAEERLIDAINNRDGLGIKLIYSIRHLLGSGFKSCSAEKGPPRKKSDIVVSCNTRRILISVKEFEADYNQVERNYVEHYAKKWAMPPDVYLGLKQFVGEVNERRNPISTDLLEREAEELGTTPGRLSKKRRTFLNELPKQTQNLIREFFNVNREKILKDIFIDDEEIEFFIVVKLECDRVYYYLVPTKNVLIVYGTGNTTITPRGSLQIGKVVIQRKSGNHHTPCGWADGSASQLQFKIKPSDCIKGLNPLISEKIK
jgi:hypothetical protein